MKVLPEIHGLGDPIRIEVRPLPEDGPRGWFDERTGEIVIDANMGPFHQFQVFLHEVMHLAETAFITNGLMDKPSDEQHIHDMSTQLALILVCSGVINGVAPDDASNAVEVV